MNFRVDFSTSDEVEESPGHGSDFAGISYMGHAMQGIFSGDSQRFNEISFLDHVARAPSNCHGVGRAVSPH
jgi:hypothetical protein